MSGKILGLGGVFFKVDDIEAYRGWWSTHMGVDVKDWGSFEWRSDGAGFTMMSPFKADSDYFTPSQAGFMINLRVEDVPALIARAKAGGAEIIGDVEDTDYGIFGWFIDPAGLKIELWQNKSEASAS
jgi:predicted enzyme related to lactoylglutathione lyase